ncbi:MAG TPA: DUF5985 family protein [Gemmatimonadales bacterium]|nr:DUF5985 family protein [Gemmatimonadales bacterium]
MEEFLAGALAMAFAAAALFFLRFWRATRDRLFGLFACAFALMSLNRLFLTAWPYEESAIAAVYLVRLAAFLLILLAIVDKNRGARIPR